MSAPYAKEMSGDDSDKKNVYFTDTWNTLNDFINEGVKQIRNISSMSSMDAVLPINVVSCDDILVNYVGPTLLLNESIVKIDTESDERNIFLKAYDQMLSVLGLRGNLYNLFFSNGTVNLFHENQIIYILSNTISDLVNDEEKCKVKHSQSYYSKVQNNDSVELFKNNLCIRVKDNDYMQEMREDQTECNKSLYMNGVLNKVHIRCKIRSKLTGISEKIATKENHSLQSMVTEAYSEILSHNISKKYSAICHSICNGIIVSVMIEDYVNLTAENIKVYSDVLLAELNEVSNSKNSRESEENIEINKELYTVLNTYYPKYIQSYIQDSKYNWKYEDLKLEFHKSMKKINEVNADEVISQQVAKMAISQELLDKKAKRVVSRIKSTIKSTYQGHVDAGINFHDLNDIIARNVNFEVDNIIKSKDNKLTIEHSNILKAFLLNKAWKEMISRVSEEDKSNCMLSTLCGLPSVLMTDSETIESFYKSLFGIIKVVAQNEGYIDEDVANDLQDNNLKVLILVDPVKKSLSVSTKLSSILYFVSCYEKAIRKLSENSNVLILTEEVVSDALYALACQISDQCGDMEDKLNIIKGILTILRKVTYRDIEQMLEKIPNITSEDLSSYSQAIFNMVKCSKINSSIYNKVADKFICRELTEEFKENVKNSLQFSESKPILDYINDNAEGKKLLKGILSLVVELNAKSLSKNWNLNTIDSIEISKTFVKYMDNVMGQAIAHVSPEQKMKFADSYIMTNYLNKNIDHYFDELLLECHDFKSVCEVILSTKGCKAISMANYELLCTEKAIKDYGITPEIDYILDAQMPLKDIRGMAKKSNMFLFVSLNILKDSLMRKLSSCAELKMKVVNSNLDIVGGLY